MAVVILREGLVQRRGRRTVQRRVLHIADDTNDFHIGNARQRGAAHFYMMAKRILSREVPLGNAFTNDHTPGRVLAICLSETSAPQKRNTQRAEVIAADGDQRSRGESVLCPGLALDNEG